MSDLKPCPFCGKPKALLEGYYHVRCTACQAQTGFFPTQQEAIDAWNCRASQWRSVADDPPPDGAEEIFAIDCHGRLGIAEKSHDGEGPPVWECWEGEDWFEAVWWMPSPALPETRLRVEPSVPARCAKDAQNPGVSG